jgi:hypothetical protein
MSSNNNTKLKFENDHLVKALIELSVELEKYEIPLIIGGGLSLYLRTVLFNKERSPRYPKRVAQRSTKDIDIFLSSDLIVDAEKIEILRDSLSRLDYKPKTKYFQFSKEIEISDVKREIIIDILSSPPKDEDKLKTKIRLPRIKPVEVQEFHAYLVNEAKGINYGPIPINPTSNFSKDLSITNLYIPSSYNFIILKLHAFQDRREDESVDLGRHHCYDVFATVTDMDKNDWEIAKSHYEDEKNSDYIISAKEITKEYFASPASLGIIRLKENQLYIKYQADFNLYIDDFISDLKSLFNIS